MISEHYAAVQAMLPAGLKSYKGSVPTIPEYPYVLLWGDPGEEISESLGDVVDQLNLRIRATYAGLTFDSVVITAKRVRAALNRKAPTVTGWAPGELRQSPLIGVQEDTNVTIQGTNNHPQFAVDEFLLVSDKA